MKDRCLCLAALSVLLSFAAVGCGQKKSSSETSVPASNTSSTPVDAATAGSISGTVQLDGAAPKMKAINMAAEPSCAKQHSTPATTQEALAGKNGALENVVVYLKGDFSHYKFDMPQTPATITQKGCMYDPHVLVLETGQTCKSSTRIRSRTTFIRSRKTTASGTNPSRRAPRPSTRVSPMKRSPSR